MLSTANETRENKNNTVTDGTAKKQSHSSAAFHFADNRPAAIAQRKMQEFANNSQQVKHLMTIHQMANNSIHAKGAMQMQQIANTPSPAILQRKDAPEEIETVQQKNDNASLPGIKKEALNKNLHEHNTATGPVASNAPVLQGSFLKNLGFGLGMLTGVGALGYGLYRYYRHRRRENTLADIHNEQAPQVITATNNVATPSEAVADNPNAAQALRTYHIDMNNANPLGLDRTSPELINIATLHERTHISADMAYSENAANARGEIVHANPLAPNHVVAQYNLIDARLQTLTNIVTNDSALTALQRADMHQRLNYAGVPREYDPVINELLAYSKTFGIRANSKTVKALVELARENLTRRTAGGPHLQGNWPA
ncbi:hypothetical protein CLV51_104309 [Chitinophaga niastensis]|uniref:Uncharacterized protein n=1 Tax=Chitinophaga niastensis TaxID=536980 RepID=A0A2P8HHB4_CHINA|nr:hypothetical protein [Chitinophaga niastensis]PSL45603.1 hypothetical protein CLV51_104309 [Chitinophaga niastensis]